MTSVAKDPLQEFTNANHRHGGTCGVAVVLAQLDEDHRARLTAALAAGPDKIQHTAISRVLTGWGHELRYDTIRRHRNQQCSCDR